MARTTVLGRLNWHLATVVGVVTETHRVRSIVLDCGGWPGHRPGQHVDVRLTAEDGYQAQRSYSIASAPEDRELMITVERLADGEVSPYLVDVVEPGDKLELRGPIGGYFVWEAASPGQPLLLIAGGAGIVPFRSMLRHWSAAQSATPLRVLYSSRSWDDVIYTDELARLAAYDEVDIRFTLTRSWPAAWNGHRGRIDDEMLAVVAWRPDQRPLTYICGPSGFVEAAADALVRLGHDPLQIRTERFGPTS